MPVLFKHLLPLFLLFVSCPASDLYCQAEQDSHFFSRSEVIILFETDKYELDSVDEESIYELRALGMEYPGGEIRLEARTDFRGSEEYNRELARNRLNAVEGMLRASGLRYEKIIRRIYGERNPMATNETREGRQLNRSVRIIFGHHIPSELLSGQFVSQDSTEGVQALLYVTSKYQFDTLRTAPDGSFSVPVPKDGIVSLEAYGNGYVYEKEYFNLNEREPAIGLLPAKPVIKGAVFDFSDILFVGNEDIILPEYVKYLPRLLMIISGSKDFAFEIQGHVNSPSLPPQPEGTFQYDLAQRRAKRIYKYLVEAGVDSSRLEWKGYSNWHMIYPNARSAEQQQKNRRVSVKVLGEVKGKR